MARNKRKYAIKFIASIICLKFFFCARPELVEGCPRALEDIIFNPGSTLFHPGTHQKELKMGIADECGKTKKLLYDFNNLHVNTQLFHCIDTQRKELYTNDQVHP